MNNEMPKSLIDFLNQLKAEGVPQAEYTQRIRRYLDKKAWSEGIPLHGHFELTPLCNLDCKMCYVHLNHAQMRESSLLSVEQWNTLIDHAFAIGMRQASLTGGECLTYPGFDEVYLHLISKGVRVNILTNGVLLDRKRIDFLKKHRPSHIHVTLYGSNNTVYEQVTGHPKFDTVWENLQLAKQAELPLQLSITPNRYMEADADSLIEKAQSLGLPYIINNSLFDPREDTGRSGKEIEASLDTYIRMYKKKKELNGAPCNPMDCALLPAPKKTGEPKRGVLCGSGMNSFHISWNGEMYPCGMLRMFRENPFTDDFAACWDRIHQAVQNLEIPAECRDCPYEAICGVCPVPHMQNGKTDRCNPAKCQEAMRYAAEGIFELPKEDC